MTEPTIKEKLATAIRDGQIRFKEKALNEILKSTLTTPKKRVLNARTLRLKALRAVRTLIGYAGDDAYRQGMSDTPKRVVKSYKELFSGYKQKPEDVLKVFDEPCDTMVILSSVEFYSTCEHHMIPFVGKATIAYIPSKGKVVGLSKLARLLEIYTRRFQIQERIGQQVVDALEKYLKPKGAACVLHAKHFCMCARGVNKQHSVMTTSALSGVFKKEQAARAELLTLIPKDV